ncbi:hypothetical protein [Streptomyces sp. NPDC001820]|uniref:hypothetical protein n=1 Tax=Streptomyces sp. NPDC001820 TaxID=3364613 RepID=UPI0036C402ED
MPEKKYRVTWKHTSTGKDHVHVKEFKNIDHGYDFYQSVQRDADCYKVTWDHIWL